MLRWRTYNEKKTKSRLEKKNLILPGIYLFMPVTLTSRNPFKQFFLRNHSKTGEMATLNHMAEGVMGFFF